MWDADLAQACWARKGCADHEVWEPVFSLSFGLEASNLRWQRPARLQPSCFQPYRTCRLLGRPWVSKQIAFERA